MADQPFLFFVRPAAVARARRFGGGGKYVVPTPVQQRQRLQEKFEQIAAGLREVQNNVGGLEPEQVIVLETLTDAVEDVAKAASRIPGLEWLAERDLEDVAPEFGFQDEETPDNAIPRRLYALFTNQQAMENLLGLWEQWQADPTKRAKSGFGPFKGLFSRLRDVRRWGPQDRIADTGIRERWEEDVAVRGQQGTCLFEIEFWYRSEADKRRRITDEVLAALTEPGGQFVDQALISEIRYHAVLAELPANAVQETLQRIADRQYTRLLNCEGVMFFRPRSQSRFGILPTDPIDFNLRQKLADRPRPADEPLVALLDGLPLENHEALQGRIIIDDPDDHAALYQATQQQHGTAMASLLIHGDLNGNGSSLPNPIYVRPVLQFEALGNLEITPPRKLFVDVLHRAVRRIFEAEGDTPPAAPSVKVINLSIGDPQQPFLREMSALARLLDWLAWKYKVLFVVSAGNCTGKISITTNGAEWRALSGDDLAAEVLRAMRRDQFKRRLLSPAESINCLTVGATHADDCQVFTAGNRVNLLEVGRLPSPISTVANGFRRSTKPEILAPGGRMMFMPPINEGADPAEFTASTTSNAPGQLNACPGTAPFELGRVSYSCGSSNAAILASRYAAISAGLLSGYELPADCNALDTASLTVLLKALLVHSASWDAAQEVLDRAFMEEMPEKKDRRRIKQQFLGFGEVQSDRCFSSSDQRATLLGWSTIREDEGQIFSLPLPPSLAASTEWRRLTVTLAWLTPINNKHKNYRIGQLFVKVPNSEIGTPDLAGLDEQSAQRGTVEHRVFEGEKAKAFVDGANLSIQVNCRADAGDLNDDIPFAVVASLEVAQTSQIAIYEEISARIRPQVEIEAG
jgi:hypothetical protein